MSKFLRDGDDDDDAELWQQLVVFFENSRANKIAPIKDSD